MANEGLVGPGISGGGADSGSNLKIAFTRGSLKYDSPFMDMTSTFIPKSIKSLIRYIAACVLSDGFVSQCITKLSEYPITDLIYNEDKDSEIKDDKTIEKWKKILEKKLKIIRSMKQAGMDYYAYGNAIISINYPFKRFFTCKQCNHRFAADSIKYKFKDYKFYGKCPKCKSDGRLEARDRNTKEIDKFNLIHWDLIYIDIKYNTISGDHFYFYKIPPQMEVAIKRGDIDIISTTRLEVIEAVKKKKPLKLMADNVFHLKRSGPQYVISSERGWGIPAIMPVMKDIFHTKILKKGNEMIAFDHIVPLRLLFPQGTGDISPHATVNLSGWRTKIEDEIRKWKADPNYISVVPLPIGQINFSGDAKVLSITPELKATEDTIITGIGIIPEIIRGGASWSGSNVSLRVVENTFINHRNDMHEYLEFVVENVSRYLDMPEIDIRMADFKMADDMQKKQLIVNAALGSASKTLMSKTTVTKELGFDPEQEYELKLKELKKNIELMIEEMEGEATAQGSASVVNAMYQADAQAANADRLEVHDRESQGKKEELDTQMHEENADTIAEEVAIAAARSGLDPLTIPVPNLILMLTQRFAIAAKTNPDEFKMRMLIMKNSTPSLYQEVYNNLKELNIIEADINPDKQLAQKMTPGEFPVYSQGDIGAETPPTPTEMGADPVTANQSFNKKQYNKQLPESRPPVSPNSPV